MSFHYSNEFNSTVFELIEASKMHNDSETVKRTNIILEETPKSHFISI
jgi:hypothetical protein